MKAAIKKALLRFPEVKRLAFWMRHVLSPLSGIWSILHIVRYVPFLRDWFRYRRAGGKAKVSDWYPCLLDDTGVTGFDPQYFYQAAWVMRLLAKNVPAHHVDVGSDVRFVGVLTAITHVTFIDIRPLSVELENFDSRAGSVLNLPYPDQSLRSLSCLHVIEHIGLGRYGDPIDIDGSVKACHELARVLAPDGLLYVSVPIGRSRVQFNGQRVFSADEVVSMFGMLQLVSLSMVDADGMFRKDVLVSDCVIDNNGWSDFGLGIFVFTRINEVDL